jgi:hypothetical protein
MKRSRYGIKQSLMMWYQMFGTYILNFGFARNNVDHCVYTNKEVNCFIYVVLHVNDILLVGNNMEVIKEVKMKLSSKFDLKDLSEAKFIMGMEIKRGWEVRKLWLNQRKYIETILKCFNM